MKIDNNQRLDTILTDFHASNDELIPILQAVQGEFGYLSEDAMEAVARFLHLPPGQVFGVATFYSQFRLRPVGRQIIRICRGTACHVRGTDRIIQEIEQTLGIKPGETTADLEYSLETIACVGSCALAPVMVVDDTVHGRIKPSEVAGILGGDK